MHFDTTITLSALIHMAVVSASVLIVGRLVLIALARVINELAKAETQNDRILKAVSKSDEKPTLINEP